jgi:hypothetical protein
VLTASTVMLAVACVDVAASRVTALFSWVRLWRLLMALTVLLQW